MIFPIKREICQNLSLAESQEWLVTNGIGGYASGTITGLLTRRYHGLLIASLKPPVQRTLLVTKLDETAIYFNKEYPLYTNRWISGIVEPKGYQYLNQFHLEGTTPLWTYTFADVLLEKRVWMQQKENTTYVKYSLIQSSYPVTLSVKALINYRDHHHNTKNPNWQMQLEKIPQGVRAIAFDGATPFYLFSNKGNYTLNHDWYLGFQLAREKERGFDDCEDHLHGITFDVTLQPWEDFTIVISTLPHPQLDDKIALTQQRDYEKNILTQWRVNTRFKNKLIPEWVEHLVLIANQFIVDRATSLNPEGKSIIAGYHWFNDWGRDTMISLPGLTLATGKHAIAHSILSNYSHYLDQGMLPNVFPDVGETPQYNTVDATLWYFQAIYAYYQVTKDRQFLQEIYPKLVEIIHWHCQGTRYQIKLDPKDGLIYAGENGSQLTWMDAKIGDLVITPRIGKPIEINALWYNALVIISAIGQHLDIPNQEYQEMAKQTAKGFNRYWDEKLGYCYDVIDTPQGNDSSLRPNQLFAIALPNPKLLEKLRLPSLLTPTQEKKIMEISKQLLLTPYGLRSLAPTEPKYEGYYQGNPLERDSVYHQGTVWGWLIGVYLESHLKVYQKPQEVMKILETMSSHLKDTGIGNMSEIFDGNFPHFARGAIGQAWTVAEVLRIWFLINNTTT